MQTFRAALLAGVTLFYSTGLSFGQVNATGTFSGQVTDATGAALPNASVKVTEQQTGIVTSKQSASDGYFTVPLLKPGLYSIEVSASGFSTAVRKDIALQIQQVVEEDFTLQVGNIQQQVTVEGGAPLLNTE